ncbi:MAG: lysophospholipid acyltransferase family protein [Bryobacteraceae bacterium]|nr:lysophospholipid acyltransferase family protein [Bryobacteraceae bacterium]
MRGTRVELPRIHKRLLTLFSGYVDWYLRRNFHCVRVAASSYTQVAADRPLVVCLNHPSWWDPLVALELAMAYFPTWDHYAPIDAAALRQYRFFRKLGFFGVEPGTASGASTFLRIGEAALARPSTALWVTAQGHFADPRVRPTELRPGTGHLLSRLRNVNVLPVAIEYPFWEERFAEVLVRFGEPVAVDDGASKTPDEWSALVASRLEATQNRLAESAVARDRNAFQVLTMGRVGIGVYDLWRTVVAALRGHRVHRAHGPERL